jgi:hypothetical protein
MPTFTNFSDLLPDPNFGINSAGATFNNSAIHTGTATKVSDGVAGPGFAKIKFTSDNTTQVSRTISGRGVTASPSFHRWSFDISYNPMSRDEFDPVSTFLESRRGRLNPFYVILPQHSKPKNAAFATYTAATPNGVTAFSQTNTGLAGAIPAGSPTIVMAGITSGTPSPGDFFTITDSTDVNHRKAYKVIRVEDNNNWQVGTTTPTTTQRRIWTQPPISRSVASGAIINFINPQFRVIQKGDTMEYDLDTDNLYQFSLSLEEILP